MQQTAEDSAFQAELIALLKGMQDNILLEQSCLLKGSLESLKDVLQERQQLAKSLEAIKARGESSLSSEAKVKLKAIAEPIKKQMDTNRFLLAKKIEFLRALLKKSLPQAPKTYDSYGYRLPQNNQALINREG
ncbi:MAG: hypothetical protein K0S07_629 [Chlamydiales bacterium]|jgi:hypothetical protein|nr:hypothetical protein [Chlamydiales bacterium]